MIATRMNSLAGNPANIDRPGSLAGWVGQSRSLMDSSLAAIPRHAGLLAALTVHGLALAFVFNHAPAAPSKETAPIIVEWLSAAKAPDPRIRVASAAPRPAQQLHARADAQPRPQSPAADDEPRRIPATAPAAAQSASPLPATSAAPENSRTTVPASRSGNTGPSSEPLAASAGPATAHEAPTVPPIFNADYLNNPAPAYPSMARRMGEQGRVVLRVHVSAAGRADEVEVQSSSGSGRLDASAGDAVRRWKFAPARRGNEAVPAWVLVPVSFKLES